MAHSTQDLWAWNLLNQEIELTHKGKFEFTFEAKECLQILADATSYSRYQLFRDYFINILTKDPMDIKTILQYIEKEDCYLVKSKVVIRTYLKFLESLGVGTPRRLLNQ